MDELQKRVAEMSARNYYQGEVPAEHWKKLYFEMCDQRDELKAKVEALEAQLSKVDGIPVVSLIDYYYNSLPRNYDAMAAAKILDPWIDNLAATRP